MKTEKENKNKEKKQEVKSLVGTRGRVFEGTVIKKFPTRIVIEFDKTVYLRKFERYYRRKTKLHARIPEGMILQVGDYVKIRECRPLSKIIHFVVIEKVRSAEGVLQ